MSFQPVIPLPGLAGWSFLNRTFERQLDSHANSPAIKRDVEHFRDVAASLTTAEALVSDRAALRVALAAFGLEGDLDNRYFIRTVLEEGSQDPEALANKLADKRYLAFARAFRYGPGEVPNTILSSFPDDIVARYETRSFETAVGQVDGDLRLALNARRELAEIASRNATPDTLWFSVLGSPPLRRVFETTFGLPSSFAGLDLDRQLEVLRDRAAATFGNGEVAQFADAEKTEDLIRQFLLRAQIAAGPPPNAPGMVALTLLQGSQASAASILTARF